MHADEFLKEVLDSPLCPKNFETIYREFQQYQQLAMNTLNEFHRVCEKNGISYQLAYGSLLGAIRDEGMIPWDYDVDVWVPYCEVSALISALQRDLSEDYYFNCMQIDSKWPSCIMRLAPKGYSTRALHVDVFYMIGLPDNEEERPAFIKQVLYVFHTRRDKLDPLFKKYKRHPRLFCRLLLKKIKYKSISVADLNKQFHYLANKYPFKQAEYCMGFCGISGRTYQREKLWDTKLISLPSGTFRVTKNYDYSLHHMYGDYKRIFPLKDRLNEMMRHYRCLKKDAKYK